MVRATSNQDCPKRYQRDTCRPKLSHWFIIYNYNMGWHDSWPLTVEWCNVPHRLCLIPTHGPLLGVISPSFLVTLQLTLSIKGQKIQMFFKYVGSLIIYCFSKWYWGRKIDILAVISWKWCNPSAILNLINAAWSFSFVTPREKFVLDCVLGMQHFFSSKSSMHMYTIQKIQTI